MYFVRRIAAILTATVMLASPSAHSAVGLTGTVDPSQITPTGVSAGSYTCPNLTLNAEGQVTAATSGSCGGGSGGRTLATGNISYYVNCSTGSNSNDGTSGSPFADPVYAYNLVQRTIDLSGQHTVDVTLQAACPSIQWVFEEPLVGAGSHNAFTIHGTSGNPSAIVLYGAASAPAIRSQYGAEITLANVLILPGSGGSGLNSLNGYISANNIYFETNSASNLVDVAGPRSLIEIVTGLVSAGGGNMTNGFVAEDHGQINLSGSWIMNGSPQWNGVFVQGDLGGMIDATGFSFTNAGYGGRCNAISNALVSTGTGAGQSFFPGNTNGSSSSGGICQ